MGNDPLLEQALRHHLRFAPLSRAELVRRTGAADQQVQAALDELIRRTYVVRRPQDGLPDDYELTPAGQAADPEELPFKLLGKFLGASMSDLRTIAATDERSFLLSDDDRAVCANALGEQFALGRIDKDEHARRTDLLFAARTRADLEAAFDGLPVPDLADPAADRSWVLPFVLSLAALVAVVVILSHPTLPLLILLLVAVAAGFVWKLFGRRFRR